ncbi:MAG: excisionase family DNA-binding protein [Alphaproteobacteria bacterium]|nr:excisionase family DNA-binding protein [Alphaproteobacteria bacterium]MDE2074148.1 helix-turn-helix domain-containing protein [Alphaproteobacteria bacterium]MDE2352844.1 helix-turn-helix domain-containing protein [Alphaproteobacteria bacterium]
MSSSAARAAIPFEERLTCSVAEACTAVGLSRSKIYELISGGAVETVMIGRRRLVRVPSLKRLLLPSP